MPNVGFEPRTSQLQDLKKYSKKLWSLNPIVDNPVFQIPSSVFRIPRSVFRTHSSVFRIPSSVFRIPGSVFRIPRSVFRNLQVRLIPMPMQIHRSFTTEHEHHHHNGRTESLFPTKHHLGMKRKRLCKEE